MLNRRRAFSVFGGAVIASPVIAQPLKAEAKPLSIALDVSGNGLTPSEIMDLGDRLAREIAAAQASAMARVTGARNFDVMSDEEKAKVKAAWAPHGWRDRR